MKAEYLNPLVALRALRENRYLLGQLVKRDVLLRYRGALFGVVWAFINPLILLAIYTLVFGHIFPSRWPDQGTQLPNAVILFAGFLTFNLFADSVSRAPMSVRGYPAYVKKIIFPLEILPMVPMGTALVHGCFNSLILVGALAWFDQLHWGLLMLPVIVLPLLMMSLGLTWFLAAWGVFIKDTSQIVPVFVQMLMFMSPVFYPAEAVPVAIRQFVVVNPIASTLENVRAAIYGVPIQWDDWGIGMTIAAVVLVFCLAFFQHNREEFADVL